jgi:hypothetical protein
MEMEMEMETVMEIEIRTVYLTMKTHVLGYQRAVMAVKTAMVVQSYHHTILTRISRIPLSMRVSVISARVHMLTTYQNYENETE